MSRLDEMEVAGESGTSVDELRAQSNSTTGDEHQDEAEIFGSNDEVDESENLENEVMLNPSVNEFQEINPLLDVATATKMAKEGMSTGQATALLDESVPRRARVKSICDRIEGLTSREIATMIGLKYANAIYKHVDKLNEVYEDEGFYYELITRGQKKSPTKKEIEQYEERFVSL